MAKQTITIILEDDTEMKDGEIVKTPENSGKLGISFHVSSKDDDGSFSFLVAEGLTAIFPTAVQHVIEFAKVKAERDNRKIVKH
ncbi:hypothetical protein GTGU_04629 [Trabulsiella guamensis ATCC 49490]|uniref:Uncharacterized protein n=1 Tax=Trabulsiella guamensis ATCC 49490 TaxID=1005994 RepID=A0A084ZCI0_9ENTR|nr:hypothetical protein [Trabulsiella guamensis]KFB95174.1 hypothetical protein GTGU_04704 [Trabulsiella guamensis ATCC 49490]KFB95396.1 hypothetical protein GTGU_04698 [Trabulsiella guamensis ATCC 49490]KFB97846.1 hypothetical protein GTGU_04629 [Trabulsiella guamensis ATCC 49490]